MQSNVAVIGSLLLGLSVVQSSDDTPRQTQLVVPEPAPVMSRTSMLRILSPAVLVSQGLPALDPATAFAASLLPMARATIKVPGQVALHAHYLPFKSGQALSPQEISDWYAKSTYIGSKEGKPTLERLSSKRYLSRLFRSYSVDSTAKFVETWVGPRGAWVFFSGTPDSVNPEPATEADFRKALLLLQPLSALNDQSVPAQIPDLPSGSIDELIVGGQLRYKGPPLTFRSLIDAFGGLPLPLEGYYGVHHSYAELPGLIYMPLVIESFGTGPLSLDPLLKFVARDRGFTFFGTPKSSPTTIGGQPGVRYELQTKNGEGAWTTEITAVTRGLTTFTNLVTYRSDSPEWTRLAREVLDGAVASSQGIKFSEPSTPQQLGEFAVRAIGVQSPSTGNLAVPQAYRADVAKMRGLDSGTKGFKLYGIEYELKDPLVEMDLGAIANDFESKIQAKHHIERTEGDLVEFLWGPKDYQGIPTYGQRADRTYLWVDSDGSSNQGCYSLVAYKTGNRVGVLFAMAEDATKGLTAIKKWSNSVRWIVPKANKAKTGPPL